MPRHEKQLHGTVRNGIDTTVPAWFPADILIFSEPEQRRPVNRVRHSPSITRDDLSLLFVHWNADDDEYRSVASRASIRML